MNGEPAETAGPGRPPGRVRPAPRRPARLGDRAAGAPPGGGGFHPAGLGSEPGLGRRGERQGGETSALRGARRPRPGTWNALPSDNVLGL